jgi:DNA-3-methyladenine glycosylase II
VLIRNETDLAEGVASLLVLDPAIAPVVEVCGRIPLRRIEPGFAGLAQIVVSQMVSKASASAIWNRIAAAGPVTADTYLAHGPEIIATFGLSRAKATALTHIAEAVSSGDLKLEEIALLPEAEAYARLISLRGVGPWTAQVYLMFCVGRADIFPEGDVALRAAIGHAFFKGVRPSVADVVEIARRWSPWRAVAARIFWAYYATQMRRDALPSL